MPGKNESHSERKQRARRVLIELKKLYPTAHCALEHKSALQLLISTILSAQSTDETVNKVTPILFARYPAALDLSDADRGELEQIIYPTGFFRQKAKSIQGACSMIVDRFDGRVPDTMEELIQLPGVARKTANVILGTWFGKNDGVVVDTHVGRLAERLGLTWSSRDSKDAVRIENDLTQILPQKVWTFTGHALIWHGRKVCSARKPDCEQCTLSDFCPSAFSFDGEVAKKTGQAKKPKPKTRAVVRGPKKKSRGGAGTKSSEAKAKTPKRSRK